MWCGNTGKEEGLNSRKILESAKCGEGEISWALEGSQDKLMLLAMLFRALGALWLPKRGQSLHLSHLFFICPHPQPPAHTLCTCGWRAFLNHSTVVDESYPPQVSYFITYFITFPIAPSDSPPAMPRSNLLSPQPSLYSYLNRVRAPTGPPHSDLCSFL